MTPFFRRIRRKLANDNQFLKYSRYAIGEILLVVVGILIALQINNWNENKKADNRTKLLLEKTNKELLYNIKRCNGIMGHYWRKDTLFYNVINKKVSYDDYKKNGSYRSLIKQYRNALLVNEEFNTMIENDREYSEKQDSIILSLKGLYGTQKKDVDRNDDEIYSICNGFSEKLRDEKSWYGLDEITNEEINYYLKDSFYFNNVRHYELFAYRNHMPTLVSFKIKALSIYKEISANLGLELDSTIVKNANNNKHYLGVYEINNLKNLHFVLENDRIITQVIDKNDTIVLQSAELTIESKEFFVSSYGGFGELIFDKNGEVTTMVYTSGSFKKEYKKIE